MILITGGAGFIGSHIADYLVENFKIRVLDNLSTGSMENIKHLTDNSNFEFMYGDISNIETCRKACKGVTMICHQGALGSVPRSIEDPLASHLSNVNGFLNILISAKENGIKRIVYASSSSVYGDSQFLPKIENIIGKPLSPYAVTKYVNELYGTVFNNLYNLEIIGLRYFNVFGKRQNPHGPYSAVIPKFIDLLKLGKTPEIYGDGNYSRDFTYISNIVDANVKALFTDNCNCFGEVFNIGAGGRITINEMYDCIAKHLNTDIKPKYSKGRKGDVAHSNANISKAKDLLGYVPMVNFSDGIKLLLG